MDKYKATAEKRLSNTKSYGNRKIHPEELARRAHVQGKFAARERDEFFDEAYGDILVDLFLQWLKTEPHETKSREFLYATAMALGSVKEKMINIETYGKNVPIMKENESEGNK